MLLLFSGLLRLDFSDDFIVGNTDAQALSLASTHAAAVSSAIDGVGNFFLTIHTGLFVIVGFAINASLKNADHVGVTARIAIGGFVLGSLITFYFAYLARFQMLERINAGHVNFSSVLDTVSYQGIALSISSLFAICAAGLMLAHYRDSPTDGSSNSIAQPREEQRDEKITQSCDHS